MTTLTETTESSKAFSLALDRAQIKKVEQSLGYDSPLNSYQVVCETARVVAYKSLDIKRDPVNQLEREWLKKVSTDELAKANDPVWANRENVGPAYEVEILTVEAGSAEEAVKAALKLRPHATRISIK